MVTTIGRGIGFCNILDECEGEGHRLEVKVTRLNKVIFRIFRFEWWDKRLCPLVWCRDIMSHHTLMSRRHVTHRMASVGGKKWNRFSMREVQQHFKNSVFFFHASMWNSRIYEILKKLDSASSMSSWRNHCAPSLADNAACILFTLSSQWQQEWSTVGTLFNTKYKTPRGNYLVQYQMGCPL